MPARHMPIGLVPLFDSFYLTQWGVFFVTSKDYVVMIRIRDGMCKRLTWEELGF